MAGRVSSRAIVLGGADCVWTDYEAAKELVGEHVVIATNHAARDFEGQVAHAVTMHPDIRDRLWTPQREKKGLEPIGQLWHPRHRGQWEGSQPIESWGGSSGLLAVRVAFELQCTHIVLAGVPLLPNNGHYDDPKRWNEARQYHGVWQRMLPRIKHRTRSMSGWTRELLGAPTRDWLDGDTA